MSRDEDELIAAAQRDRRHFGELYDRHFDDLYAFVVVRSADVDEAQDVTGQTLHQAFHGVHRYKLGSLPVADWLNELASTALAERGRENAGGLRATEVAADPSFKRWLKGMLLAMAPTVHAVGAQARIGVLADTHCQQGDGSDLSPQVFEAFAGVNLIIHCGDIGHLGLLDRLEAIAPVLAVKGMADVGVDDPRVSPKPRIVEAGGMRLGVVFDLEAAGGARDFPGGPVDAIVCGATHGDRVAAEHGILVVNPGSPNLHAAPKAGEIGTAAVLEIRAGTVAVDIVRVRK